MNFIFYQYCINLIILILAKVPLPMVDLGMVLARGQSIWMMWHVMDLRAFSLTAPLPILETLALTADHILKMLLSSVHHVRM